MTLDVLGYEGRKRVKSALGLSAAFAAMAVAFVALSPQLTANVAASDQFQRLTTQLPAVFVQAFGLQSMTSLSGLLAGEFYTLFWAVFFGLYLAYTAAGSITGDIDTDRMDTLLSNPVSRTSVLVQKYLALLVPILIASVLTPAVIDAATQFIEPSIDLEALLMVHLLSIPYLLCCGAIGIALSVLIDGQSRAQNAALGVIFSLYLLESFVVATDVGWLGNLAPMAYFDANEILLQGTYDYASAGVLLAATVVLIAVSQFRFERMDIQ